MYIEICRYMHRCIHAYLCINICVLQVNIYLYCTATASPCIPFHVFQSRRTLTTTLSHYSPRQGQPQGVLHTNILQKLTSRSNSRHFSCHALSAYSFDSSSRRVVGAKKRHVNRLTPASLQRCARFRCDICVFFFFGRGG